MSSFPVLKDLDKQVTDIFTEDFDTKYNLKIKSPGPSGLTFTTNTLYDVSKEAKLVSKVSFKWPHHSGFTLEKLEVANNGAVTTETSLAGTYPGLKLEFKGNDSNKGDLSFTFLHKLCTLTSEVDALNLSKASASVSSAQGPYSYGLSADFNISKSALGPLSATVGYSIPNVFDMYIKSGKTFTEHSLSASYIASKDVTLATQALSVGSALNFSFAALYKCNPDTILKVKTATDAGVSLSVKQAFDKKLTLTGVAEIPKTYDSVKFGIAVSLG